MAGASHRYAVTTLPVFLIEFFTVPELAELAIRRYFLFRIRRFINLTHEHALASGLHPNCFGRAKDYAVDESIAQAGLDAFAEAMELSENDAIRARVEKASICAYRAAIEPIWYMKDKSKVDPALAERMQPLVKRFVDLCEKYGVTNASERSGIEAESERIKRIVGL